MDHLPSTAHRADRGVLPVPTCAAATDRPEVIDDFELGDVIARSGMGSVYKACHRGTGDTVVLKVPHLHLESDVVFYERFAREERIGLRLVHPAIVRTIQVPRKSRPYIVQEYIEGASLRQRLRRGPFDPRVAFEIGARIAEALVYIHGRHVVHRDLKPDNILFDRKGHLRIIDFGIAFDDESRRLTWGGLSSRLGTPEYMAPEQVRGRRGDGRADVYALGLILYEMLAGATPYRSMSTSAVLRLKLRRPARPLREVAPTIDPAFARVVMRAIATRPSDRYADAREFLAALRDPGQAVVPMPRAATPRRNVLAARLWTQASSATLIGGLALFVAIVLVLLRAR